MGKLFRPDAYVSTIFGISPKRLMEDGIYGLIIDIDNTLVPTHTPDADEKVKAFIKDLNEQGIKTVIVSNARKERVEKFCEPLNIDFVYKALKPLGKGFNLAVKRMGLTKDQVAIVGDQLFTDILGGNLSGIHSILLEPIDFDEPFPIRIKRIFEKPFLSKKVFKDKY